MENQYDNCPNCKCEVTKLLPVLTPCHNTDALDTKHPVSEQACPLLEMLEQVTAM